MNRSEIVQWLREPAENRLETLWERADAVRSEHVGDEVHLRGLVELSNHCRRSCHYCGLRADNAELTRYRMSRDEVLEAAGTAVELGYGTIVMQAGEDPGITEEGMAELIRQIKAETPLAVTLSLGERTDRELKAWRAAGADRYLLRFETSNPTLYRRIHPAYGGHPEDRIDLLHRLRELGYEVGSGVMIGIPGQTYESLARDIELFAQLDLDMIGCGPFIAHPKTPLGETHADRAEQVPADQQMTFKVLALARIVCPDTNIPATTALATLNRDSGRELGLQRGANVVMPNLTPTAYRQMYEIYPGKACVNEGIEQCHPCILRRIDQIGRRPGRGRGDSVRYRRHTAAGETV